MMNFKINNFIEILDKIKEELGENIRTNMSRDNIWFMGYKGDIKKIPDFTISGNYQVDIKKTRTEEDAIVISKKDEYPASHHSHEH